MNIIEPSAILYPADIDISETAVLKKLELYGRVAYKSEDKITDDSTTKFIQNIIKSGHESVLEHHVHHFVVEGSVDIAEAFHILDNTIGFHITNIMYNTYIVSMNTRTLSDAKRRLPKLNLVESLFSTALKQYPTLYKDLEHLSFWDDCLVQAVLIVENTVKTLVSRIEQALHVSRSVRLICDRGVSHEFVRQRLGSPTQESTRYCNYSKKGMTVIDPFFWQKDSIEYNMWYSAMEAAEAAYNALMSRGCTPQQARSVLPNSLKTELIFTTNLKQWQYILNLRTQPNCHPQMIQLMKLILLPQFQQEFPGMFEFPIVEE
jgi:thymidylate synthase (FAD)